jgi:ABC-2 type transport system ATP-binding protein
MASTTTSQPAIVEAVGLTKVFRDFWFRTKAKAVDNIDFSIHAREIFGLLGPNGSGKSTTIKMILGLLHVTRGRLSVFGKPPTDVSIKRRIGFLPEESYLYRFLNPQETLDYYGKLFGLDRRTRKSRTQQLLDMVGLGQVAHRPVGEFSKGMQRRVGIAQALINDPDFLILDEPTSGLDPIGTRQVKDLIIELGKRGKTILLSSHLLADVEDVCDRVVMLYGGKIRAQGPTKELLADTASTIIQTPRLKPETISRIERVLMECEGVGIDKVEAPRQRLEQLFMDIVDKARREQVETSGAREGAGTAEFLRAEPGGEGDALIGSLVRGEQDVRRAQAVDRTQTRQAGADAADARDDVLRGLLEPDADAKPARAAEAPVTPDAPKDVDDSVIQSLLDGGAEEEADGKGPGR